MARLERPPLRAEPTTPSRDDVRIIDYWARSRWGTQDLMLLPRERQIDENIRMVLGQQHLVWVPLLQRHFDVAEWFEDPDRRIRERVTINKLLSWFVQTLARMSENPPILTWLPMTDQADAEMADVLDRLHKWHWRRGNGPSALAQAQAWSIVAGAGYLLPYIDPQRGPWRTWEAPVPVEIVGPNGEVLDRVVAPVPVTEDGRPTVRMTPAGQPLPIEGLRPMESRRGDVCFEVLSPLEVRGEWGPKPWYAKSWHAMRRWMTEQDIWDRFQVEVAQGPTAGAKPNDIIAQRNRFGSGHYPGTTATFPGVLNQALNPTGEPLHEVLYCWEAPSSTSPGNRENAGGRYTVIVDQAQVVTDGPRPIAYPFTSPLHEFSFFTVPGRNWPTSPQEPLNSPQRHINKERTHVALHTHLNAHPMAVIDRGSGITRKQWTNEPGTAVTAVRRPGVPAVEMLQAPVLGESVWRHAEIANYDLKELGMLLGTEGAPLNPDSSGEAIKETRFNSDRYLGVALREQAEEMSRVGRTLHAHYGVLYDREELVRLVGEDSRALVIHVTPQLFDPESFDVISDSESMLPESRFQRQERALNWYREGLLGGPPGSFPAIQKYWELARFPHQARAAKPGGEDALTAERFLGLLLDGTPGNQLPVFPWYDNQVFLFVLEKEMKSWRFLEYPPEVQQSLVYYRAQHEMALQQKQAAQQAAEEQAMMRQAKLKHAVEAEDENEPSGASGRREERAEPESADSRPEPAALPRSQQ